VNAIPPPVATGRSLLKALTGQRTPKKSSYWSAVLIWSAGLVTALVFGDLSRSYHLNAIPPPAATGRSLLKALTGKRTPKRAAIGVRFSTSKQTNSLLYS